MSDARPVPAAKRGRRLVRRAFVGVVSSVVPAVVAGAVVAFLVASSRWYLAVGLLLAIPAIALLHRYPMAAVVRGGALVAVPVLAVATGAGVAYLVANGAWYLAVGLLLAIPAFVLLHRYPLAAVTIWLLVAPLVTVTESSSTRKVFWLVHRGLPAAALAALVLGAMAGISTRKLARLGLPELMMIGYVIVTMLSIAYTSSDPPVNLYLLYDRVVAPMCLYLIVRLLAPDENGLKRLIPAAVFLLVSQSLIGVFSWVSPDALPSEWLGKVGERTTGSLRSTDVFTITVLFCGLFLLHAGLTTRRGSVGRVWAILLFVLAVIMVFVTFSRASWLAGLVAVIGALYVYRTFLRRLAVIVVPLALLLVVSGLLHQQIEFASYRVDSAESEQTALSRLPVAYAAVRMFEAKPIVGWGYENFNQFDLPFQGRVGDIVYPDKDHSSHNLYLTTLAEQGIVGFVLLLGPACLWFLRWRSRRACLPKTGFLGGRLVATLWLILAAHVVVNNFSRMQVTFGFGMWWLTLGLIATIVDRYRPAVDEKTRQTWTVSGSRDLARSWQR